VESLGVIGKERDVSFSLLNFFILLFTFSFPILGTESEVRQKSKLALCFLLYLLPALVSV
jgi:hypothetical protein